MDKYSKLENLRDLKSGEVEKLFEIGFASPFEFEQELREHAKIESLLHRYAAIANKKVSKLQLVLKITVAEIVDRLRKEADTKGKPIPPSAIGELRKSVVPKEPEFQQVTKALYKAEEEAAILNGLLTAWTGRGFRLQELAKISERTMWGEPRVYNAKQSIEDSINDASQNLLLD